MKKLFSVIFVFALIGIFGLSLNAQTTEVKGTKKVAVIKTVVERKQATSIQRVSETDQNNSVVNEVKETQTTPESTTIEEKPVELKKCVTTTTNCQKKCTTPCHQQQGTNEADKKPVPKF